MKKQKRNCLWVVEHKHQTNKRWDALSGHCYDLRRHAQRVAKDAERPRQYRVVKYESTKD